ncbi:MAG: Ldh family oxidoreductase [Burkholderiales bacterium]|nr:Ldh family oxidoreductase [Burkholderiales bacterium]
MQRADVDTCTSDDSHDAPGGSPSAKIALTIAEARSLAERALRQLDYSAEDASLIADALIDSELCGYSHLGLTRILSVAENPKTSHPREPLAITRETECSALIDGGNTLAVLSLQRATEVAIRKAKKSGIGLIGLYNSYFSGRGAFYLERIARADLVGIHFASATPMVVPIGGARPALGTNPIAVSVPSDRGPLIFDVGTASIMFGDMILKARLGEPLPPGVAIDAAGRPTCDANEALRGGVLPFGGHRGYALSCCVQVMGLLAGAALARGDVQDYGFLLIVLDPGLLLPVEQFKRQVSELVDCIKATPRQDGVEEIRVPSERAFRERERRLASDSISLDSVVHDALKALIEKKPLVRSN